MASIAQTINKIESFGDLPNGWHYGSGEALNEAMLARAIEYLKVAEEYGLNSADAFPNVDGEVGLSLYRGPKTLSITLELDGTFSLIEDINNRIIFDSYEVSENVAIRKLWEFSHGMQISSALSTLYTGNLNATGLISLRSIAHLRPKTQTEESLLSRQTASEIPINPFALTSSNTTLAIS